MTNKTQIERYKKLLSFIDSNFKEHINIEKVEQICNYSYRNINRIFEAIHQETIGKYVKRLRLEKAAQYLKYSEMGVSDIAFEVGFEERAAFSKAFKKKYGYSPSEFRASKVSILGEVQKSLLLETNAEREKLQFEIEYLPDFEYIFLEYRGDYKAIPAIEKAWNELIEFAFERRLLTKDSIFMSEIIDDDEISDSINLRYNLAIISNKILRDELDGFFRVKKHHRQKYAKFVHEGDPESCYAFYTKIYALWMLDVDLELADLPTLEFYPDFDENDDSDSILTEIYIPVN